MAGGRGGRETGSTLASRSGFGVLMASVRAFREEFSVRNSAGVCGEGEDGATPRQQGSSWKPRRHERGEDQFSQGAVPAEEAAKPPAGKIAKMERPQSTRRCFGVCVSTTARLIPLRTGPPALFGRRVSAIARAFGAAPGALLLVRRFASARPCYVQDADSTPIFFVVSWDSLPTISPPSFISSGLCPLLVTVPPPGVSGTPPARRPHCQTRDFRGTAQGFPTPSRHFPTRKEGKESNLGGSDRLLTGTAPASESPASSA